jgi:hypothetical protein
VRPLVASRPPNRFDVRGLPRSDGAGAARLNTAEAVIERLADPTRVAAPGAVSVVSADDSSLQRARLAVAGANRRTAVDADHDDGILSGDRCGGPAGGEWWRSRPAVPRRRLGSRRRRARPSTPRNGETSRAQCRPLRQKCGARCVQDLRGAANFIEGRVSGQWRAMRDGSPGIHGSLGNMVSVSCRFQRA